MMDNSILPLENENKLDMKLDTPDPDPKYLQIQVVNLFCYKCSQQFDTCESFNSHHRTKPKTNKQRAKIRNNNKTKIKGKLKSKVQKKRTPSVPSSSKVVNGKSKNPGESNEEEEDKTGGECNNGIISKWKCDVCSRYFSTLGCLKRHVKSHHAEEAPFICMCGLEYYRADTFRVHLEKGGKHQMPDFLDEAQVEILYVRRVKVRRKQLLKMQGKRIRRRKGTTQRKKKNIESENIKSNNKEGPEIDKRPPQSIQDDIPDPEFISSHQNEDETNSNDALNNSNNNNNIDMFNDNDFSPSLPNDIFSSDYSDLESHDQSFLPPPPLPPTEPLVNEPSTSKKSRKESRKKKEKPSNKPKTKKKKDKKRKRKSLNDEDEQVQIKIEPNDGDDENEEYINFVNDDNSRDHELEKEEMYKQDSEADSKSEPELESESDGNITKKRKSKKKIKTRPKKYKKNKNKDDDDYEDTMNSRPIVTTDFQCIACFKYFVSEETLQSHTAFNEESDRVLSCPEESCDLQFEFRCVFNRHIQTQHPKLWKEKKEELYVFECRVCSLSFRKRSEYTAHTKTHRKFICEVCGKILGDPKGYAKHVQNHFRDNPKPYPCTEPNCNKAFSQPNTLKTHIMNIHRGMKPFLCQTCGFETSQNGALQSHMRTHSGEKPYKCEFPGCGYSAATNGALKQHAGRHTNHRSFVCTLIENGVECGKGFNTRPSLRNHVMYHLKRLDPENAPKIPKRIRKSKKRKAEELAFQQQQLDSNSNNNNNNNSNNDYPSSEHEENRNLNINQIPTFSIPSSISNIGIGLTVHQPEFLLFP